MMTKDKLGRLKTLGVESLWQVPLLLPRRHEFFSREYLNTGVVPPENQSERTGLFAVKIDGPASIKRTNLATYPVIDAQGVRIWASQFGYAKGIAKDIANRQGQTVLIKGIARDVGSGLFLNVEEVLDLSWLGKVRPVYPANKSISADTVRTRIASLLEEAIPMAAEKMRSSLPEDWMTIVGSKTDNLELILTKAHYPDNPKQAQRAYEVLQRIDALYMLTQALKNRSFMPRAPLSASREELDGLIEGLPFELTDTQKQAIDEIVTDLRRPVAMRRVLLGDVGTGKTVTYLLPAVLAARRGMKVAIMLPNVVLANQIFKEAGQLFSDANVNIALVQGGTGKKQDKALKNADIIIGTTALLHKKLDKIDWVIADEQQKFSREQRERLMQADTHLLEVSATPIPRTQALTEFGGVDLSMLKQGHANKTIHTKIRTPEERTQMMEEVRQVIEQGAQAAIIYPLKEESEDPDLQNKSAIKAFEKWEKHFPGKVRLVHGSMTDDEKRQVIQDMKEGKANLLISTTVIEVGVTIPKLEKMVIVDADRYGLSQLHQLRGRLVRHGGTGYFDLYLSEPKEESIQRLSILEKTNDGFKVAEHDLKMRGYGDLDGEKQSGLTSGFLVNAKIPYDALQAVADKIDIDVKNRHQPVPWLEESGFKVRVKSLDESAQKTSESSNKPAVEQLSLLDEIEHIMNNQEKREDEKASLERDSRLQALKNEEHLIEQSAGKTYASQNFW